MSQDQNQSSSASSSQPTRTTLTSRTSHIGSARLPPPPPSSSRAQPAAVPASSSSGSRSSPPPSTTRRTSASVRLPPFRSLSAAWSTVSDMPSPSSSGFSAQQQPPPNEGASSLQRIPRVVRRPRPSQSTAAGGGGGAERTDFGSMMDEEDETGHELAGEGEDWEYELGDYEGGNRLDDEGDDDDLSDSDDGLNIMQGDPSGDALSWSNFSVVGQGRGGGGGATVMMGRSSSASARQQQDRVQRTAMLRAGVPGKDDGTGLLLGLKPDSTEKFTPPAYLSLRPFNLASPTLPTHFSPSDRSPLLSISPSGLTVSFIPRTSRTDPDLDAAAVRANAPIDPNCGLFYFEVEIINAGERGYIGIGFSAKSVLLCRLPGWERDSYGYHGDDGLSFSCQGEGRPYAPPFTTGDIVGCGLDFSTGAAFYTKNGLLLGSVFQGMRTHEMYPTVGLRTPREVVKANFGQFPFRYDIASYFKSRQLSYLTSSPIYSSSSLGPSSPLSSSSSKGKGKSKAQPDENVPNFLEASRLQNYLRQARLASQVDHQLSINPDASMPTVRRESLASIKEKDATRTGSVEDLVKSYLVHRGYLSTFENLRRDQHYIKSGSLEPSSSSSGSKLAENTEGMDVDEDDQPTSPPSNPFPPLPPSLYKVTEAAASRVRIRNLIVSGDLASALVHLEAYPDVQRSEVGFELKLCHLVGMILMSAERRKVESGEASSEKVKGKGKGKEREGTTLKRKAEDEDEGGEGEDASSATQRRRTGSAPPPTHPSPPPPSSTLSSTTISTSILPTLPPTASFPDIDILDRIVAYGRQLRFTLEDPATAPPVPSSSSSTTTSSSSRTKSQMLFSYCLGLLAFEDPLAEGVELGEGGAKALGLWTGRVQLAQRIEEALLLSRGETKQSELETVVRHTIATHTEMGRRGKGVASFVDVRSYILM